MNRAHTFRNSINLPEEVQVRIGEDHTPARVRLRDGWRDVAQVVDRWLVEDGWWRTPISRMYFELDMGDDGMRLVVFWDQVGRKWFKQRY